MTDRRIPDERVALLEQRLDHVDEKLDALTESVRDLVDAWRAAGLVITFVKTAAAIVFAIGVLYGAIKYGFSPKDSP